MRPASPARRLRWQASVIPFALVAALFGCSDAPSPVEPRLFPERPFALVGPTIVVTNVDDSGPGSLRQAIIDAVDGTTIRFDAAIAGQTIVLSTGELVIDDLITIEAPVPAGMTISGGLTSRVFQVAGGGDAVLRNLSIVNGRDKFAGGLYVNGGKLVLDHSLVANNQAAEVSGGGIFMAEGNLTLVNSTVSGNTSVTTGGGILAGGGATTIRNTTIAFNTSGDGGGIFVANDALSVRNSIIANNIAIGASAAVPNCVIKVDAIFSGRNISDDDSCGPESPTMIVADPRLKQLADNGGPTKTHAMFYSAAVDGGAQCTETTDQRYVARNQGVTCDLGAYEFNDYERATLTIDPNAAVHPKTGVVTLTGTITCSRSASLVLNVNLSQTQKTKGKFTTIVKAVGGASVPACGTTPSTWSAVLTAQTGQFTNGEATAVGAWGTMPADFVLPEVTREVKLFNAK